MKKLSKGQEQAARILKLEQDNAKLKAILNPLREALYLLLEDDIVSTAQEVVDDRACCY
jgi:hypothetical protein